jgi:hypothetical protein
VRHCGFVVGSRRAIREARGWLSHTIRQGNLFSEGVCSYTRRGSTWRQTEATIEAVDLVSKLDDLLALMLQRKGLSCEGDALTSKC